MKELMRTHVRGLLALVLLSVVAIAGPTFAQNTPQSRGPQPTAKVEVRVSR